MRTAPQEAARNAPDGEALFRALEMTPDEVTAVEQGEQAGKRRGRRGRVRFGKHQPRHAVPAEGTETAEDAETAAMEFRGMKTMEDIEAALESGGALKYYQPPPKQTGPQPMRATGPQPSFTPNEDTGPQPRHRNEEARLLDIAHHRADRVPVPDPPAIVSAAAFAQNAGRIAQLPLPGYDASDGYGSIPAHVAYMRRVSYFTGTASRFEFPGAWPLPVAPQPLQRRAEDGRIVTAAVTAGAPLGEAMPGCWSLNAETGEKCGNAMPPPHGDHPHIGPSGDEWTDESGTYCGGDVDCTCWDHRQAAGIEAAS